MDLAVGDQDGAGKALRGNIRQGIAQSPEQPRPVLARGDARARADHPEIEIAERLGFRRDARRRIVGPLPSLADRLALALILDQHRDIRQRRPVLALQ